VRTHDQLVRDAEPFPDSLISKLPPRGDSYVPWYQYAQRLLLHHPGHSYRVTGVYTAATGATTKVRPSDLDKTTIETVAVVWAVAVELEIDGQVFAAVGEDDSPTSAESNAYKRAAAHAGIGLHLYDEEGYWLHRRLQKDDTDE